jgi:hypothetical protein
MIHLPAAERPRCVQLENGDFRITELPLRKWTQDYKEFLDSMVKPEDKNVAPLLLDYKCGAINAPCRIFQAFMYTWTALHIPGTFKDV